MPNPWRLTRSGRVLDPLHPRAEDIDPEDIAWGLARMPRWAGQTVPNWSVLDHSLEVARRLPAGRLRLWGLLHDAAEAYLGDAPGPLKGQLFVHDGRRLVPYEDLENGILAAVAERFGLRPRRVPAAVVEVDARMLATERRDLMAGDPYDPEAVPYPERIPRSLTAADVAAGVFLDRLNQWSE